MGILDAYMRGSGYELQGLKTAHETQQYKDQLGLREALQGAMQQRQAVGQQDAALTQDFQNMGGGADMGQLQQALGSRQQQPISSERLALDYWRQRDPQKAQELETHIGNQALLKMKLAGDSEAGAKQAVDYYNSTTGSKLEYAGKDDQFHYFGGDTIGYFRVNKRGGEPEKLADAKPEKPLILGEGQSAYDPNTMQPLVQGQPKIGNEYETFIRDQRSKGIPDAQSLSTWNDREISRKKAGASNNTTNVSVKNDGKGVEAFLTNMPKQKDEAENAVGGITRIDKMLGLIDVGAAGSRGYAKSKVAPLLELVGVQTKGMNDAQLYQVLAKTMAGSLRAQVVGPGPVSNYEQELLKQVSTGGMIGAEAAKELLTYYKGEAQRKVNVYNNSIDSVSKVAPETAGLYQRIDLTGNWGDPGAKPPAPARPNQPKTPAAKVKAGVTQKGSSYSDILNRHQKR